MPYTISKGKGKKPYKIKKHGRTVGSSTSKAKAKSSVRARNAGAHGWKSTKK